MKNKHLSLILAVLLLFSCGDKSSAYDKTSNLYPPDTPPEYELHHYEYDFINVVCNSVNGVFEITNKCGDLYITCGGIVLDNNPNDFAIYFVNYGDNLSNWEHNCSYYVNYYSSGLIDSSYCVFFKNDEKNVVHSQDFDVIKNNREFFEKIMYLGYFESESEYLNLRYFDHYIEKTIGGRQCKEYEFNRTLEGCNYTFFVDIEYNLILEETKEFYSSIVIQNSHREFVTIADDVPNKYIEAREGYGS